MANDIPELTKITESIFSNIFSKRTKPQRSVYPTNADWEFIKNAVLEKLKERIKPVDTPYIGSIIYPGIRQSLINSIKYDQKRAAQHTHEAVRTIPDEVLLEHANRISNKIVDFITTIR